MMGGVFCRLDQCSDFHTPHKTPSSSSHLAVRSATNRKGLETRSDGEHTRQALIHNDSGNLYCNKSMQKVTDDRVSPKRSAAASRIRSESVAAYLKTQTKRQTLEPVYP